MRLKVLQTQENKRNIDEYLLEHQMKLVLLEKLC